MIVVANRLSHNRFNEIQRDIDSDPNRIFAYVNFYIPPIVDQDQSCSLCLLISYYRRIKSLTSLESCKHVISKNSNRISVTNFDYTSGREEGEEVRRQENIRSAETRQMCRMLLTHEIYYRLSMVQESVPAEGLEKKVYDELKELLNGEWDGWLDPDHRITRELPPDLDKYWVKHLSNYRAIAFLKVLSSPPLSQYILIRKFAHSFLLEELKSLFSIPNPRYIDAKLLRVTLKGLSMMKSNALVRKEVIESSLKLFREALGQITDEMSLIIRLSEAGQGIMNQGLPDAVKEDFGMLLHAYNLDNTMEGWKRERFRTTESCCISISRMHQWMMRPNRCSWVIYYGPE